MDVAYTSVKHFKNTDPDAKRIVVLGCTGAGKSTLLNTVAGWRFVQKTNQPDAPHHWEPSLMGCRHPLAPQPALNP